MANMCETGGIRRLSLRGRPNIRRRLPVHASGFNLGVLMRPVTGIGTPRTFQGQGRQPADHRDFAAYSLSEPLLAAFWRDWGPIGAPPGENVPEFVPESV